MKSIFKKFFRINIKIIKKFIKFNFFILLLYNYDNDEKSKFLLSKKILKIILSKKIFFKKNINFKNNSDVLYLKKNINFNLKYIENFFISKPNIYKYKIIIIKNLELFCKEKYDFLEKLIKSNKNKSLKIIITTNNINKISNFINNYSIKYFVRNLNKMFLINLIKNIDYKKIHFMLKIEKSYIEIKKYLKNYKTFLLFKKIIYNKINLYYIINNNFNFLKKEILIDLMNKFIYKILFFNLNIKKYNIKNLNINKLIFFYNIINLNLKKLNNKIFLEKLFINFKKITNDKSNNKRKRIIRNGNKKT